MSKKSKKSDMQNKKNKIAILGLGYVGLPLAIEFGKQYETYGYDVNKERVRDLRKNRDSTLEVSIDEFNSSKKLTFTSELSDLSECNIYVVTVPTPIDDHKQPDLSPLLKASNQIGKVLSKDNIVIFESTVFPGATEDECVPVLERSSSLKFNHDFFVGYSPERINPGDEKHKLANILKITSGSSPEIAETVDQLYSTIIEAGTFKASSIKVAEAAKVIENTQRDLNIGLINELALIFNKLGIDTEEVLKAAGTKWNFLPFRPGLVGGHCIGVDPYYLTYKAQALGYHPQIILAGRRLNDSMGTYVASQLVKGMIKKKIPVKGANALILGVTFKENCPDVRNTKIADLAIELEDYGIKVDCYDPWVDELDVIKEYGIKMISKPKKGNYDAIVAAVAHDKFRDMDITEVRSYGKKINVIYDLKYIFAQEETDLRL